MKRLYTLTDKGTEFILRIKKLLESQFFPDGEYKEATKESIISLENGYGDPHDKLFQIFSVLDHFASTLFISPQKVAEATCLKKLQEEAAFHIEMRELSIMLLRPFGIYSTKDFFRCPAKSYVEIREDKVAKKSWLLKFKIEAECEDSMSGWHTVRKEVSIPLLAASQKEAERQMGLHRERFSYDILPSDIKAQIPDYASLIFSDWRVEYE